MNICKTSKISIAKNIFSDINYNINQYERENMISAIQNYNVNNNYNASFTGRQPKVNKKTTNFIKDEFKKSSKKVMNKVKPFFEKIKAKVMPYIEPIKTKMQPVIKKTKEIWNIIKDFSIKVWNMTKDFAGKIRDKFKHTKNKDTQLEIPFK